jgi:hypothetical protein
MSDRMITHHDPAEEAAMRRAAAASVGIEHDMDTDHALAAADRRRPIPEDRWGCSRDCIHEHTYTWGQCEHATPPPPRLGLLGAETFTDDDGERSMRLRHLTVEEAKQRIAEFEGPPTLRGLIRAARAAGAPLRRHYHEHGITEYWQCWDEGARRRRAKVRHWPQHGTWRVEIYGRHNDPDGDNAVHIELMNPTIEQIAAAARLCGWDVGGVS